MILRPTGRPLEDDAARADLQSARIEYKHLQCDYRIKNPYIIYIVYMVIEKCTT